MCEADLANFLSIATPSPSSIDSTAIAVAERTRYIGRIRKLAREVAQLYLQQRESLGFPLLKTTGDSEPELATATHSG
jgi:hypothetical protein